MRPFERWDSLVKYYAEYHKLPVDLVKRQMMAESAGDPRAVSSAGAKGLMQLMPGTAWELGVKDPFNPDENLRGGTLYLAKQIAAVKALVGPQGVSDDDAIRLGLAAYNCGYGYVRRAIRLVLDQGVLPVTWPLVLARLSDVRIGRKQPKVWMVSRYVADIHPSAPVV